LGSFLVFSSWLCIKQQIFKCYQNSKCVINLDIFWHSFLNYVPKEIKKNLLASEMSFIWCQAYTRLLFKQQFISFLWLIFHYLRRRTKSPAESFVSSYTCKSKPRTDSRNEFTYSHSQCFTSTIFDTKKYIANLSELLQK